MSNSRSPGGSLVYRHQSAASTTDATAETNTNAIVAHFESHIGKVERVWHELISDKVHLDVHFVAPSNRFDCWTLFTTGMSALPMTTPEDFDGPKRAELILRLPANWPLTEVELKNDRNFWPVRWLKTLARLPHDYRTWLWPSHTIPNGDPAQPLAENTKLSGLLVIPAGCLRNHDVIESDAGAIALMSMMPLYEEEMQFKLERGYDALLEKLADADINDVLDIARVNVCKKAKRKWFWQ